jgi:aldose 1-epimerase
VLIVFNMYQNDTAYFGALVGRVANRIAGGHFPLNGKVYKLPINSGKNTLHGMFTFFSKIHFLCNKQNSYNVPSTLRSQTCPV